MRPPRYSEPPRILVWIWGLLLGLALGIFLSAGLRSCDAQAAPPFCPPGVPDYCCEEHATAYLRGGTERDREDADRSYLWCMIARDVPEPEARSYHRVVRMFAGQTCAPPAKGCWRYGPSRYSRPSNPASTSRAGSNVQR